MCKICDQRFKRKQCLTRHIKEGHLIQDEEFEENIRFISIEEEAPIIVARLDRRTPESSRLDLNQTNQHAAEENSQDLFPDPDALADELVVPPLSQAVVGIFDSDSDLSDEEQAGNNPDESPAQEFVDLTIDDAVNQEPTFESLSQAPPTPRARRTQLEPANQETDIMEDLHGAISKAEKMKKEVQYWRTMAQNKGRTLEAREKEVAKMKKLLEEKDEALIEMTKERDFYHKTADSTKDKANEKIADLSARLVRKERELDDLRGNGVRERIMTERYDPNDN